MKKHNTALTAKQLQRRIASKARRQRRQAKIQMLVNGKLKPFLAQMGTIQAEVNRLRSENNRLRAGMPGPETAPTTEDTK